jgi:regulator of protease activity HflC (stomatin/prohibitin superfamily)
MGNTLVRVPQQYAFVVEYFGRFQKTLEPGLHFLIPFAQRVAYKHSLKEQSFSINAQNAVTKDNVYIQIDGVLYLQVDDPFKCSYGAKEPLEYTYVLAQSVMRSEIGKLDLDSTFRERETLNSQILESISSATLPWGIRCLRYEIKDIKVGESMKKTMNLEAESERQKRAEIKVSEGKMKAEMNIAEGHKRSKILQSQASAEEILLTGRAISERINNLSTLLGTKEGEQALKYGLADMYLKAIRNLGDSNKNLVIKSNLNEPDEMIKKGLDMLDLNFENRYKKSENNKANNDVKSF